MPTFYLTNYEVQFSIEYEYFPGESQTKYSPAEPPEIEILNIFLYGEKLTQNQVSAFIQDFGEYILTELCINAAEKKHFEGEF